MTLARALTANASNPGSRMRRFTLASLTLTTLVLMPLGCARPPALSPVVEAEDVAAWMQLKPKHRPILLDARSAEAYDAAHVAGAVHVDPAIWTAESLSIDHGLENTAFWQARLGQMGLTPEARIAVYDNGSMTDGARIWFILQMLGASQAAVVNGGYPAIEPLVREGRVAVSSQRTILEPQEFHCPPPAEPNAPLVDRDEVKQAVVQRYARVWDARTPAEYAGVDRRKNARGGHLPGAVCLAHDQLLDKQGRLRSPEELADLMCQAGLEHGRPIIVHCDGGGRASLAALAAVWAGYDTVWNYYRSFSDWARDDRYPLDSGTATALDASTAIEGTSN